MRFRVLLHSSNLVIFAAALWVSSAAALPFNTDMMNRQPVAGAIMRPKAPGSVPVGSLSNRIENRDQANKLENPLKGDALSEANGERLFSANCTPCHGRWVEGKYLPSSLPAGMASMDLTGQRYRDMTDGVIYGTIHFGSLSTLMPGYGWKFSPTEHWDMVNYIRKVQSLSGK